RVTATEKRDEKLVDHPRLPDDHPGDLGAEVAVGPVKELEAGAVAVRGERQWRTRDSKVVVGEGRGDAGGMDQGAWDRSPERRPHSVGWWNRDRSRTVSYHEPRSGAVHAGEVRCSAPTSWSLHVMVMRQRARGR